MLRERKLDALLVTALPNLRYLSGFTGSNGMLLVFRGGAAFCSPTRATPFRRPSEADCRVKVCRRPMLPDVMAAASRGTRVRSSALSDRA